MMEPFQMTIANRKTNVDWPNWMHEAWNLEQKELGSLWGENWLTVDQKIFCQSSRGTEIIPIDSWLVKESSGGITVCLY